MFYEKIDLYRYYSLKKPSNGAGLLTVYCRERQGDLEKKKRPAMLVIPGGGYEMVSAREGEPVALRFVWEGFGAFVLEYTVKTPYPVPLLEGAMAICYIRENAEKYGVDPAQVGVLGFSAGGHLAGMLSTLYGDANIKAALGERLVRPDAAILCYSVISEGKFGHSGTMDRISGADPALRKALSLETRVTGDCPPVFLWHTAEDDCVPVENTLLFAAACRRAGVPFELHVFEKGWHGTSVASIETEGDLERLEKIDHLPVWLSLAVTWLKKRGFCVRAV